MIMKEYLKIKFLKDFLTIQEKKNMDKGDKAGADLYRLFRKTFFS